MFQLKSIVAVVLLLGLVMGIGMVISPDGITGSTVINNIACSENSDCNDFSDLTEDVCMNHGTIDSVCFNRLLN